ncbi:MAG: NUDIX domain-containing protein [Hyphomicrobiales bacterium]
MALLTNRQKLMQTVFLTFSRFSRGMTMGVRAMVCDEADRVLLVKHTYVNGWYFPGGAIDPGEHAFDAVERELIEEAGIGLTGLPRMVSVFQNINTAARDHVVFFECPNWRQLHEPNVPNREIAEIGFFALEALPDDISPGTLRRLTEKKTKKSASPTW